MIQVVVQHHPSRAELLPRMLERLGDLDTTVITDVEDGPPSPWRCYRRCLEHAVQRTEYTHTVILQDDALPCTEFECEVGCSIAEEPDAFLVLWLGGQPAMTGMAAARAWTEGHWFAPLADRDWVPAVATCMPTGTAQGILDWTAANELRIAARRNLKALRSDDMLLGEWRRATSARVLVTVPSIVQHPDDVPSLVGNGAGSHGKNRARTALYFIDSL